MNRDLAPVQPDVSVVVPVYNVKPYLRQCLTSVLEQSIGLDRLELVAVDDGSTDGSAEILDEFAAQCPRVRVVHEPNSGGPGRPRNLGLDLATGTYVFFLDADDYLGPEALERLVAMADRNGSDVVLGKMVGVDGRLAPSRAFRRTVDRADLVDVYSTLAVMKLFRRELIERVGTRFTEGLDGGEDGPFTAELYLNAATISVVADYDCYFYRDRPGSQTKRVRAESLLDYLSRMSGRCELVARHRPAGEERDLLMVRHIEDVLRPFNRRRWLPLPPDERRQVFEVGAELVRRWHTDSIQTRLPPPRALRAYCLQHGLRAELEDIVSVLASTAMGNPLMDGHRAFARYPHFRDASGIPDSCFELTDVIVPHVRLDHAEVADGRLRLRGQGYLGYVGGVTTVVLRRWPRGPERRVLTTRTATPHLRNRYIRYPEAGFVADIDLATAYGGRPLPAGPWSITLEVGTAVVQREVPLRAGAVAGPALRTVRDGAVPRAEPGLYLSADGSLRLRMRTVVAPHNVLERAVVAGRSVWRGGRRRLLRVRRSRGAPVRRAASAWRGLRQRAAGDAAGSGQ